MRALHRKALRDAWMLRGPGLAVALVVGAGLAMFFMAWSTHASLRTARDRFYESSRFPRVFVTVRRAPLAIVPEMLELPGVASIDARLATVATVEVEGSDEPAAARVVSIDDETAPLLHLRSGRRPESPGEALVSEGFARARRLREGDAVTALFGGRRHDLTIVGIALSAEHVYAIRPGDLFPDDVRYGVLWIPHDALAAALDMRGAWNEATLTLARGASERSVIGLLDARLARYGSTGAHGRADEASHAYLSSELDQLRVMGETAPLIFLAVAAFLVHVVITRLVATQRSQIATLKAFGYGDAVIGLHVVMIIVPWSMLGFVLGAAGGKLLGRGMVAMYSEYYRFPDLSHSLTCGLLLSGLLLALAVGTGSTAGAVRRVLLLRPAEAMAPEAPPAFRTSWLERTPMLRERPPLTRLVVRRFAGKPLRAAVSILMLSFAVAILVLARFPVDAVERLIELQFGTAQRDDVTVTLREPANGDVLHDIAAIPGVLAAEPYRAVAARLRSAHVVRQTGILGVAAGSDLRRVLDGSRPVALPPEGLVLSSKLASILHVRPGDRVTVEILEGRREVVDVPVAGVADEFLGLSATMNLDSLRRLLHEGDVVSGALLLIDPAVPSAQRTLRAAPSVASLRSRMASVARLRETMNESMLRMMLYEVLLAVVIAVGIVYDLARVSLAEQARELATLRVLGFTRAETATVLMAELALLCIPALPLGLLVGRALAGLMTRALETEMFRIPLVVSPRTDVLAVLVVAAAAVATSLVMRRQVDRLDLVRALKAAE